LVSVPNANELNGAKPSENGNKLTDLSAKVSAKLTEVGSRLIGGTQNGAMNSANDAIRRTNAAAVCSRTQQRFSFARRTRALFSVLYALLLVGVRSAASPYRFDTQTGHSASQRFETSARRRRTIASSRTTPNSIATYTDTGTQSDRSKSKLHRIGALVAHRIARSAKLRDAYWRLRRNGVLTTQTVGLMKQRVCTSARLSALRHDSKALLLRAARFNAMRLSNQLAQRRSMMFDSERAS
jgi:hypothetical protein